MNIKVLFCLVAAFAAFMLDIAEANAGDVQVCVQIIEKEIGKEAPVSNDSKSTSDKEPVEQVIEGAANPEKTDAKSSDVSPVESGPVSESGESETVETGQSSKKAGEAASDTSDAQTQTASSKDAAAMSQLPPLPPGLAKSVKRKQTKDLEEQKELAAAKSRMSLDEEKRKSEEQRRRQAMMYLRRLIEHYITHQEGFVSTGDKCSQTLYVEMYPLKRGWTVFARYSGTNREEKVDKLYATELSQFAERAVVALLTDKAIEETINRENVLESDSKKDMKRVEGHNHFITRVGTKLLIGKTNQAQGNSDAPVKQEVTLYHPMTFGLGYRGRFEAWGLQFETELGIGAGRTSSASNVLGGHVDYGGNWGIGINFVNYTSPRGITSFYWGGGASFQYTWFTVVRPREDSDPLSYLHTAGLTGNGVFGWEFMRASSVQFFIQAELNLPLFVTRTENNFGSIESWIPGASANIGVIF